LTMASKLRMGHRRQMHLHLQEAKSHEYACAQCPFGSRGRSAWSRTKQSAVLKTTWQQNNSAAARSKGVSSQLQFCMSDVV
jgi:hypothetical protein